MIISVTNDLKTDQRVARVCNALTEIGFDVFLIGRASNDLTQLQWPYRTKRFRMLFKKGFLFYAEYNIRLFWTLVLAKKSLLYANDLDTLLPNYLVSISSRTPLIYDSHEFFTEVPELQARPFVKSIWEKIEARVFPQLKYVITANEKLADIYSKKYDVPVTAIRNVPEVTKADNRYEKSEKVLIYQGALNVGRGIELMIDCMEFLPETRLYIVGDGDLSEDLKKKVSSLNIRNRIIFKGRLIPQELKKLTPAASLGFSLEEDMGLNYRYALPNKIFDYIHAGIPVVVSDLPVMSKLVSEHGVGEILEDRNPRALATLVREVLMKKESYAQNLRVAAEIFNWNEEKKVFKNFMDQIENLE